MLYHFNVASRNFVWMKSWSISTSSPGMAGRSSEKSLEFFEETAVYADFTGRNREDFPDRNHRFRERLHETKVIGAWSKIGGEGNLQAY
jgi:hypothetical protein